MKKSLYSQTTVIVAKQIVLVTIQICWFWPENNVLLMLIDDQLARNGLNEILLRVLFLIVTNKICLSFSNILL